MVGRLFARTRSRVKGWSAGYLGLYKAGGYLAAVTQFDDFQVGIDNNGDDDFDDAGDDLLVSDDFNSNAVTLTHDDTLNAADAAARPSSRCDERAALGALRPGQASNLTLDTSRPALRDRSRSERRASPAATSQGLTFDGLYAYAYDSLNP